MHCLLGLDAAIFSRPPAVFEVSGVATNSTISSTGSWSARLLQELEAHTHPPEPEAGRSLPSLQFTN